MEQLMKRWMLMLLAVLMTVGAKAEQQMKADLLQMLADFSSYMKADFLDCEAPNSVGEACGCFKGENTMGSDERGVRPNADLGMICAFLVKYAKDRVVLPQGVMWTDLEQMAMKSLVFAYSTHKANRLKVCKGNRYWGSTSKRDRSWESSLWAMSVAYSAFFQWEKLSQEQRTYIYQLLKAECNYELERDIPTGYKGDTKSEENGWEADVLAATLGLFPDDALAPRWFQRLREFAINSYSQKDDAQDATVIDPHNDQTTVKDLYKGANLYDDYTLQNHDYFHTSYQNVVMQELGEAALALKLFQQGLHGKETWRTNALMHNNQKVMDEVLCWLALSDGELAMPNGNDWSLFLYDQITSYTTNACFLRDPNALMLEQRAYKMIKARQQSTKDGSWLLRADVGARRMGVEAHRVMMTWLMHEVLPTADLTPTRWDDFRRNYSAAKVLLSQNIVRASTESRFTCFSWSTGLKSYTGYIAPHLSDDFDPRQANLLVPFKAHNTGNLLGWYEVQGRRTNAVPVVRGNYRLNGDAWLMNGQLLCNDSALDHRFAIYSTPGNAVIYHDLVTARADSVTIGKRRGGLLAVSMDETTRRQRTLYYGAANTDAIEVDGKHAQAFKGRFVNIDNAFSVVADETVQMGFGDLGNNNSILTARLYCSYDNETKRYQKGQTVDSRSLTYYSSVTATETANLLLAPQISYPAGWRATLARDTDGTVYLLVTNFNGDNNGRVVGRLDGRRFKVSVSLEQNNSVAFRLQHEKRRIRVYPMQD